ncbi:MAG: FG-GAP repeat-containing protein [Verrucomicrobia bacterium]|nr:MAG: FG-GAP repeat-containing protein [Verrucomicrobiota bacterium]
MAARHAFVSRESGELVARNLSQRWCASFDESGFVATPDDGNWTWGLELRRFGFAGSEVAANAVRGRAGEGRLSYQRGEFLEEWFLNDERGLEQGWTLQRRPDGAGESGPMRLELAVRGGLDPVVAGGTVQFADGGGVARVTYSGLRAWDADGRRLEARFVGGVDGFAVEIEEGQARYPVTIDPIAQQAYLKASNTGAQDEFGKAVAIDGNVAVIGAPGEDGGAKTVNGNGADNTAANSGAAYVFVRSGKLWVQQAYLKASDGVTGALFGTSVAVSGSTAVVGAPQQGDTGAAYVFVRSGWIWTQQAILRASNVGLGDQFGTSVAISGSSILVGAPDEDSGATLVGGSQTDNTAASSGAAYVFTRSGTVWTQQAYIKASNTGAGDRFGGAVAISGDRAVVGAAAEAGGATTVDGNGADNSKVNAGAAYVYRRDGTVWSADGYLKASNSDGGDAFGTSVALSGDLAMIGAPAEAGDGSDPGDNSESAAGAAYVFERKGAQWVENEYLKAPTPAANKRFGFSVAISGLTAAVGSRPNAGPDESVYVFNRVGSAWTAETGLLPSAVSGLIQFGYAVGVSGDVVIAGAPQEDSSTTGINGNPTPASTEDNSGSGYVFSGDWPYYTSLAKGGQSAPGASDIAFLRPSSAAVSDAATALYGYSLSGAGATSGRGSAMFSTLAGIGLSDLLVQAGDDLAGLGDGYQLGSRVVSIFEPIVHQNVQGGVFQAVVAGPGITTSNNRAILRDDGTYLRLLRRTGRPITELGGASASSFVGVLQSMDSDLVTVSHSLRTSAIAPVVTSLNDSGILPLNANGGVQSLTPPREGGAAYGGGGNFGQFNGVASAAQGGLIRFTAALLPTGGGTAKQGVFFTDPTTTSTGRIILQDENAWSASPGKFVSFPAVGEAGTGTVFRATLSGVSTSINEGVWNSNGSKKLLQKGVAKDGFTVTRFIRVWPVGSDQAVFHVMLGGTGVTTTNNVALLLLQGDDKILSLLRTNDVAPGVGLAAARVASIQSVDVNPVNGHYAIVGSLRGVSAGSNQVLWAGRTTLGDNTTNKALRLPSLRLRKGDAYRTGSTSRDLIRSITLRTAPEPTGIGGRGLGQAIGINGNIVVGVTADRGLEELLLVAP